MIISRHVIAFAGMAGCLVGAALIVGSQPEPARAQPPAAAGPGRYQISAYGYGYARPNNATLHERGAYILDTQTGDVFVVHDDDEPARIGSVAEPQQKK